MNLNRKGINAKRNIDGFWSTIFGLIPKLERAQPKLYRGVKLTEEACLDKQKEKIFLEAEVKKSRAIQLAHKFQNC